MSHRFPGPSGRLFPSLSLSSLPALPLTRRDALGLLVAAPVLLSSAAKASPHAERLVLRDGWVLRADDLERLGRR